jgi:membrane-bound lytic murein transglycosylase D
MFERSYQLLLEADGVNRDRVAVNFNRVYNAYFERLKGVDQETSRQVEAIRRQAEATYQTVPVYAGQVDYFIRYFSTVKKEFTQRGFDRALRYIPMIHEVFRDAGIPPDLAYMALVESGFRDAPTSSAGARGLWQFMPATARRFGLTVDGTTDERLDPGRSTRAAAAYLKELFRKFGDWPLAVAAYNVGEGRIERLLKETGSRTYWDLTQKGALPEETERYVPSIIAVTLISRDPERYGLTGATAKGAR